MKIINPKNDGGYVVKEFNFSKFLSVDDLQSHLKTTFGSIVANDPDPQISFGYITPGHGVKGKQKEITQSQHIEEMYSTYGGKHVVVLWLKLSKKRKAQGQVDNSAPPVKRAGPGYNAHMKKMTEADQIVEKLKEKSGEKYTPEQLVAWAHMIQMQKHSSYKNPPDKPFFRLGKGKKATASASVPVGISPSKKIDLRSKCIEQLDKWHTLMERGAISADDYKEMQMQILSDIKKF